MFFFLLLFPFLEVAFSLWVMGEVGVGVAILLLIAAFFIGMSTLRFVGWSFPFQLQSAVIRGHSISRPLVRGALRFLAGVLLVFPGFLSDCFAMMFLILSVLPGSHTWVSAWIKRSFQNRVIFRSYGGPRPYHPSDVDFHPGQVRDVTPAKPDQITGKQ